MQYLRQACEECVGAMLVWWEAQASAIPETGV